MSKIQTILYLLIFLIVIFSMDMIFGNPVRETFRGSTGTGIEGSGLGSKLNYRLRAKNNTLSGDMGYPEAGFTAATTPPNYKVKSEDDQPLHYSFV